jgi:hypothetical protein
MKRIVFALCIAFSASTIVFAPSDRGTVTGSVYDPSGAVLPAVNISATNTPTGTRYETITTETGNYTLVHFPVSVHDLTVDLPSFKKQVRQGITAIVAQTLRVGNPATGGADAPAPVHAGGAP